MRAKIISGILNKVLESDVPRDSISVVRYFKSLSKLLNKKFVNTQFRHIDWPDNMWVTGIMNDDHKLVLMVNDNDSQFIKNWVASQLGDISPNDWEVREKE